jgi:hypothetical protein
LNRKVEVVRMSGDSSTEDKVYLHSVIGFHISRKTHSTIGIQRGVDVISISKQLGHKGLSNTNKYVGVDEKKLGGMMSFVNVNKKKGVKKEVVNGKEEMVDETLLRWKSMYEKDLITKDVYEGLVRDLLK